MLSPQTEPVIKVNEPGRKLPPIPQPDVFAIHWRCSLPNLDPGTCSAPPW